MKRLLLTLVIFLMMITGCSTKINYVSSESIDTITLGFGLSDLKKIANEMVADLKLFSPFERFAKERPILFVSKIKNKTSEHIDTRSITDSITSSLLRTGLFRFTDTSDQRDIIEQLDFQKNSGLVNQKSAVKQGNQTAAQYMMAGSISSIRKRNNDTASMYYKFTLRIVNIETGLLEWSNEKEIRKVSGRGFVSF